MPVSPPLLVSSPPSPASPTYPLGFRAAMIRLRAESPSNSHSPPPIILSHTRAPMAMMRAATPSTYTLAPRSETPPLLHIPLPTPLPPLLLPSTNRRADKPEVCLPPRKRTDYGFVATLDAEIRRDLERDVGYGITDTWYEMLVGMPGAPTTDDTELGRRMTEFATMRDRHSHAYSALLMKREDRLSHEAWRRYMTASDATRSKIMALCTTVLGQQAEIAALRAADRARQAQLVETLRPMSTLQTQVIAMQGQQGPARGSAQPEVPKESGSSS
ncbi:hypothetical protein Tco_1324410 [Tanacetum coccineum]